MVIADPDWIHDAPFRYRQLHRPRHPGRVWVDEWMDACRKPLGHDLHRAAVGKHFAVVAPEDFEPNEFAGTWVRVRGVMRPVT